MPLPANLFPLQVAEWLLEEALQHQQRTLHPGTPGDNITVMVVRLQPLPPLPRSTGSRLCLMKGSSGDLTSLKPSDSASPRNDEVRGSWLRQAHVIKAESLAGSSGLHKAAWPIAGCALRHLYQAILLCVPPPALR
jgi:hypothetical protein